MAHFGSVRTLREHPLPSGTKGGTLCSLGVHGELRASAIGCTISQSILENRNAPFGRPEEQQGDYVPMTSTERSSRTRARRRRGLRVVPVEILDGEIHWLIHVGLLPESERDNPPKIGRAIEKILERSARKSN
jgi:hypothetical protein